MEFAFPAFIQMSIGGLVFLALVAKQTSNARTSLTTSFLCVIQFAEVIGPRRVPTGDRPPPPSRARSQVDTGTWFPEFHFHFACFRFGILALQRQRPGYSFRLAPAPAAAPARQLQLQVLF